MPASHDPVLKLPERSMQHTVDVGWSLSSELVEETLLTLLSLNSLVHANAMFVSVTGQKRYRKFIWLYQLS